MYERQLARSANRFDRLDHLSSEQRSCVALLVDAWQQLVDCADKGLAILVFEGVFATVFDGQ